ncbi:hypothetical protein R3P38DRAFT_2808034 [Favolaschia claudopus]|uniref:Uncharacterized protein n=1 Tax=Favolaschia claudopus TaxID=2862362 RepID=A0AAV9ZHN7_9AGAR
MKHTGLFAFATVLLSATLCCATVLIRSSDSVTPTAVSSTPQDPCLPVTHVVIDSSTVEIYDASRHGADPHLRLFNMIPLACPDRHVRSLPREPSSRTDLQLRDTRTELSNIVFPRGFLSWAKSLLKWIPYASTAIGLFGLGECVWEWVNQGVSVLGATACVLGGVTTLTGIGDIAKARVADSIASANIHANFELVETAAKVWAEAGTQTEILRRSKNPEFAAYYHAMLQNLTLPGARHHSSGKTVTLWDLARANSTHPITLLHDHPAFKANHSHAVNAWSTMPDLNSGKPRLHFTVSFPYADPPTPSSDPDLENRQVTSILGCGPPTATNWVSLGQVQECVRPGGSVPSNAPATMYYGFDLYGTKAEIQEYQADLGTKFDKSNGFEQSMVDMSLDIVERQAWDTCVCQQAQGNWISTGSIQMSWDNTYNGFTPCFNPNCDNDALVPIVNH